jgi:hypothetical protein
VQSRSTLTQLHHAVSFITSACRFVDGWRTQTSNPTVGNHDIVFFHEGRESTLHTKTTGNKRDQRKMKENVREQRRKSTRDCKRKLYEVANASQMPSLMCGLIDCLNGWMLTECGGQSLCRRQENALAMDRPRWDHETRCCVPSLQS